MSQTGRREVAAFYGTRSEAVRLAPVVSELRRRGTYLPHVVTAGQHRAVVR
jgi:UDP-N-acetylglucosamine 2-epimerase